MRGLSPLGSDSAAALLVGRERRALAQVHRRERGVLHQLAHRRVRMHGVVGAQRSPGRRLQRQVERDQVAAVGGLERHLVADGARRPAAPRATASVREAGPGSTSGRRSPTAPGRASTGPWRPAPAPSKRTRRAGVSSAIRSTQSSGRHAVAQAAAAQGVLGQAPHRAGQAREQPEAGQRQRQRHRHRHADRADAPAVHARHRGTRAAVRPAAPAPAAAGRPPAAPAPAPADPGPAGRWRTARTTRSPSRLRASRRRCGFQRLQRQHAASSAQAVSRPMRSRGHHHVPISVTSISQAQPATGQGARHGDADRRDHGRARCQQRRQLQQQRQQAGSRWPEHQRAQPRRQRFARQPQPCRASAQVRAGRRGDAQGPRPGR